MNAAHERKRQLEFVRSRQLLEESTRAADNRIAAEAAYTVTGSHARWRVEVEGQSEQIGAAVQLLQPSSTPEDDAADDSSQQDRP